MCKDILSFFRCKTEEPRNVFFDTNCYRALARKYNHAALQKLFKKIVAREKAKQLNSHLSYLVASELVSHLMEPATSNSYQECKWGLQAAGMHINNDYSKVLPAPESDFYQYFFHELPKDEVIRQESLKDALRFITLHANDNQAIHHNAAQYQKVAAYLQSLKDSWIDSFVDHFIKKHEPGFAGGWQLFTADAKRRAALLNEIKKAQATGSLYREFALGLYSFVVFNFKGSWAIWSFEMLDTTFKRYKPMFFLQLRIMENICQGGYNLQKRQNDVIDYLIVSSLDSASTIFVSNETANLVPNLHSFGLQKVVLSLNDYLTYLGLKERV